MREAEYMNHSVASPQPLHMEELQPQTNNALRLKWPRVNFSFICLSNTVSAGLGGSRRGEKKVISEGVRTRRLFDLSSGRLLGSDKDWDLII